MTVLYIPLGSEWLKCSLELLITLICEYGQGWIKSANISSMKMAWSTLLWVLISSMTSHKFTVLSLIKWFSAFSSSMNWILNCGNQQYFKQWRQLKAIRNLTKTGDNFLWRSHPKVIKSLECHLNGSTVSSKFFLMNYTQYLLIYLEVLMKWYNKTFPLTKE